MEGRNFFSLDGLANLGSRKDFDVRPTLLRVLTDLYVHRLSHTPDEERHYTELALRLLEAVDLPTRVAVARRFASYLSPPLRVLQRLARDLPEVAAELRAHPLLQPPLTIQPAPQRRAATPSAERRETKRTHRDASTFRAIGADTAYELNEFFFSASAEERRLILLNLNVVAPVPPGSIRVLRDRSVAQRLEAAALACNREDFARHLTHTLCIPTEQARRIVRDDLGEPVAVAAKVLGIRRDVLYRVLMFINPSVGHSVERVHALATLYDEMTAAAAEGIVAIWQALQRNEHAGVKHRPLAWDDEARRPARPATAAQRGSIAPRPSERRNVS